jgi:hypothetical protein
MSSMTPKLLIIVFSYLCILLLTNGLYKTEASLNTTPHPIKEQTTIDLTQATIITPKNMTGPENKAILMLIEEVEKRTRIKLKRSEGWTDGNNPVIVVGRTPAVREIAGKFIGRLAENNKAEGYQIRIEKSGKSPVVTIAGNDSRGVLFGVGHLLRTLVMDKESISLPADFNVVTAPKYPLRGHQLGYRPKPNSYDGWSLPMWEQYIRDLIVFGTNAIELIPPNSDDKSDSPHFPLGKMETMIGMSKIMDEYDIDVWIWYPALDGDYADPKVVAESLEKWGDIFKKLPRVDAVMVPGGDPGHTHPKYLMPLLEKQTANLQKYHPKAKMWVAPQSFGKEWMDEFIAIVKREPKWLTGIAFGPQTSMSLPELRAAIPAKYPIRHYPDITHTRLCQYPVPDWDMAYAITESREPINPRPVGQAHIFRMLQEYTIGYITYSEGCNDDVNKFIWSGLGWEPKTDVIDILRDYSRYFFGPSYTDDFTQGLLALERNWEGSLLSNKSVYTTLQSFQEMERSASPQILLNWRFQQGLYRAYYDAYVRSRLIYETMLEEQAMERLREANAIGSLTAIGEAEAILDRALTQRMATDWRARVFELGEALYQSIRMQLSVQKYMGLPGRGNNLDTIDTPLNNSLWLKAQFAEIRKETNESKRLKKVSEIVNWTNPGPGGFYDDLGNPNQQPHLVTEPGFQGDPGFYVAPHVGFSTNFMASNPRSWLTFAETYYGIPIKMKYNNLDPDAQYKIRVVYGGDLKDAKLRLVADEKFEVHPFIEKELRPVEFDVPREATADGELTLTWSQTPYERGGGRGMQISEIWLIKKRAEVPTAAD